MWSNGKTQTGGTTSTAEGLSAGGYLVTVTDANGCTVQTAVTIGDPSNLVLTVTGISDVLCYGSATGSASVSVSGGTASYTFSWSSGTATNLSNSSTATGLAAGIHTVEVTDGNGCRAVTTVVIGQPARLTAMITGSQDITCEGETDGTATVVATGGTGSYGYLWSNGEITATATGLPEGRADVTVTDANGCTATASVWIDEPLPMAANASVVQQVSCAGGSDGEARAVAIGGTGPYTYVWNNGSTNALATGLTKGIYSVTVTDARGCEAMAEVTLTEPLPLLVTAAVVSDASCNENNGEVTATATGGTAPYTYIWSNGVQETAYGNSTITGLVAGAYQVTVRDCQRLRNGRWCNDPGSGRTDGHCGYAHGCEL